MEEVVVVPAAQLAIEAEEKASVFGSTMRALASQGWFAPRALADRTWQSQEVREAAKRMLATQPALTAAKYDSKKASAKSKYAAAASRPPPPRSCICRP